MAIDPKKYNWKTNYWNSDKYTDEEKHEHRLDGAEKCNNTRRRRRKFAEIFDELLSFTNSEDEGLDELISMELLRKALNGDIQAYQLIRDQLNEKPKDQLEISSKDSIEIVISAEEEENSESNQAEPEQEPVQ